MFLQDGHSACVYVFWPDHYCWFRSNIRHRGCVRPHVPRSKVSLEQHSSIQIQILNKFCSIFEIVDFTVLNSSLIKTCFFVFSILIGHAVISWLDNFRADRGTMLARASGEEDKIEIVPHDQLKHQTLMFVYSETRGGSSFCKLSFNYAIVSFPMTCICLRVKIVYLLSSYK